MSGRSCASGSMRSCGGSLRLGTASGHEIVLDALYERKRDKKSVRVLTVLIYVFCVSLAAIILSLYYVFFWEPKVSNTTQTSTTPMPTCFMPHTGGSNTPVNYTNASTLNNLNYTTYPSESTQSTTNVGETESSSDATENIASTESAEAIDVFSTTTIT